MCMTVVLLTEKQIKDEIDRLLNDEFDDDDGFFYDNRRPAHPRASIN